MAVRQIKGLREVNRAFEDIRRRIAEDVQEALRQAAEPIAADARSILSHYQGALLSEIRPRLGFREVYITDFAKPFTGNRGDFGALLYIGIWQAVKDNESGIFAKVEDAVDARTIKEGF